MTIILEEFDQSKKAIIEPEMVAPPLPGFPEIAISCFSKSLMDKALEEEEKKGGLRVLCTLDTEDGGIPVYEITFSGKKLAVYLSRVGAPAAVVQLEEMIARGAKKFVMLGSCGVLDRALEKWHIIIPTEAMRDEGVSYHYLSPADSVAASNESVAVMRRVFESFSEPYVCGKVWTTDAIYRETKEKTERRRGQGCIAVDMECASFFAVSQFRKVKLAQFFYAEDQLEAELWNDRGLSQGITDRARRLFSMAKTCGIGL